MKQRTLPKGYQTITQLIDSYIPPALSEEERDREEISVVNNMIVKGQNGEIQIYRFDSLEGTIEKLPSSFFNGDRLRKAIERNSHDFPDDYQSKLYDDTEHFERLIYSSEKDLTRYIIITDCNENGNNTKNTRASIRESKINAEHNLWVDKARKLQKRLIREDSRHAQNQSYIAKQIAKELKREVNTIRRVLSKYKEHWYSDN